MSRSVAIAAVTAALFSIGPATAAETDRELLREGRQLAKGCPACHDLRGDRDKAGPTLRALDGRAIGALEGYPYSDSFKDLEGVWDRETLTRFLRDPKGFAPENKMKFYGFRTDREAEAAAVYILRRTRPRR